MSSVRNALIAILSLLPAAAASAQGELSGERALAAKWATAERGEFPLDRRGLGEVLPPNADALGCGTPCLTGVLGASHDYYDVYLSCADGSFTARTGARHSVTLASGAPQNVIFGGSGGAPGTSDVTFFVHDTGTQYTNPAGGSVCTFDPPDTLIEPNSIGLEQEWVVTNAPGRDLVFRQELVAFGSTEANSGVRMTLSITNQAGSTLPATVGMRWQIDYQNGSDDGPLFAGVICDPPLVLTELRVEHDLFAVQIRDFYRIRNNTGSPIFSNVTSTTPLSGIPNTDKPDRLLFGVWGSLRASPWGYSANEGNTAVDSDSAVLYYFGYQSADAFVLAPGASVTRSAVIFSSADGIDCGDFVPGCAPSVTNPPVDRSICAGDMTTLDASGIGLTDCIGGVVYEWSDPGGVISNSPSVNVAPASDTLYTCTVSCLDDADCVTSVPVLVTVESPPELDTGSVVDADPCNEGLVITWDPAVFHDPSASGVYNVYRSEIGCADALLSPPLITGLTRADWFDQATSAGSSYYYVVEAEDARMPTTCVPQGPDHGGAVARLCLPPMLDEGHPQRPAGVGAVLFLSHVGDSVTLDWAGSRVLAVGEHFHLLKAHDSADQTFFANNPEGSVLRDLTETDRSSNLQFFDVRVADPCESVSEDEFPPG